MKNKRGKSKLFAILGIFVIIVLITSVVITAGGTDESKEVTKEKIEESAVPESAQTYVEDFVEKKGINPNDINNITEVNFNDLPKEVNIENVDDSNLAIYQINYNKSSQSQDKVFVITYSVEKLKSQGDLIVSQDKREFLNFGFSGEADSSKFLRSASGVEGSLEKGYVMMRSGSITGISTSLEILNGSGNIELVIYKNGKAIQFGNTFTADSSGIKEDYDVQSRGTVTFEAGDVISAYARVSEGISWEDATTLVEITNN
jgi:hypothetical protein